MTSSSRSVQASLPPMGLTVVDQRRAPRSMAVDQGLALLRRAVSECGYTLDALEAATGKGRAYIHKVLQGDKPLNFEFITALPDDVQARFEQLRAESFGLIVVKPSSGENAARDLVAGLLGVLKAVA